MKGSTHYAGKTLVLSLVFIFGFLLFFSLSVSAGSDTESISPDARDFLSQYKAMSIASPLTPVSAPKMRAAKQDAAAGQLAHLRETLLASVEEQKIADVAVFVVTPQNHTPAGNGKIAIYLHGGGYVMGNAYDATAARMADQLGFPVYAVEYRLAPEHPFPAALEDCLAVYHELIRTHESRNIVVFGGSAGGGLALAMLLKSRDQGLPMPAALGLSSPAADISRIGDSLFTNEGRDPVLKWEGLMEFFSSAYAGEHDPKDPLLSPVYARYTRDFPPTLLITGTRDLFLSHSVRLSRVMTRAGVDVNLRVWEGMWHGFDLIPGIPEGDEARDELARFLLDALAP